MSVQRPAAGDEVLVGIAIDETPSGTDKVTAVGRPYLLEAGGTAGLATPSTPGTVTASTLAGNITGRVRYSQSHVDAYGGETLASTETASETVSAKYVTLSTLDNTPDAVERKFFRSHSVDSGVTWVGPYYIGSLYDGDTSTQYVDNLSLTSTDIDLGNKPLAVATTGGNYGLRCIPFDDEGMKTGVGYINPSELGIGPVSPQQVAGQINPESMLKKALRAGAGVPVVAGMMGTPTKQAVGLGTGVEAFTGAGLDDITFSGTYTGQRASGASVAVFTVEVTATGTPDTVRWRKDSEAWTTGVAVTGGAQLMKEGVSFTFAATTGHTSADLWTFTIPTALITEGASRAVEPVKKYSFSTDDMDDSPRSLTLAKWPGNAGGEMHLGAMTSGLKLSASEGALVTLESNLAALGFTPYSPGKIESGSPGYTLAPVLWGVRGDALTTEKFYVKGGANTAHVIPLQGKAGDSAAYSSSFSIECTDSGTSDGKQKQRTGELREWIEVMKEDGYPAGIDGPVSDPENRTPLGIMFPGNFDAATPSGVIWSFREKLRRPGTKSTQTGIPPVFFGTPRFTDVHATVYLDDVAIPSKSLDLDVQRQLVRERGLGKWARMALDWQRGSAYMSAASTLMFSYIDKEWHQRFWKGVRFKLNVTIQGQRILVSAGVLSAYRETLSITLNQMVVTDVDDKTSGPGAIPLKVMASAEKPRDGSAFMTGFIITRENLLFPS